MTTFKTIAVAISSLLLACVSSSRAVMTINPTLEWLVCASDVVAVGKVSSCQTIKGPDQVIYEDCVLTVSEALLGTPAKEIHFTCRHFTDEPLKWKAPKAELLVCLSICKTPYDEPHLDHVFMPVDNINQSNPDSIIILDAPGERLFSGSFDQLTTKDDILRIARSTAATLAARRAANPSFEVTTRAIGIPFQSKAHSKFYGGSACFLKVPEFMYPSDE